MILLMEAQYTVTFLGQGQKYWNTKHSNSVILCKVGRWRVVSLEIYPARKKWPRICFPRENVILLYWSSNELHFFLLKILLYKKTGMHFWANPHTHCHAVLPELWCYVEIVPFLKHINSWNCINLDLKSSWVFCLRSGHQW